MTTQTTIGILPEIEANSAIAQYLDECGKSWSANAERRQTLVDDNGRPDIVVRESGRRAVVVETEFGHPAIRDAEDRLDKKLIGETRKLAEVIAVGIDKDCEEDTRAEFLARLKRDESVLSVQLVSTFGEWPDSPLMSRPSDLVAYCEYAQVPQLEIEQQSARVAAEIESLGTSLADAMRMMGSKGDDILDELTEIVGAASAGDATRIVCAIWLTTIDLHNDLATYSPTLQSLGLETTQQIRNGSGMGALRQRHLLDAWHAIEGVNYLPVMELAMASLLVVGDSAAVSEILRNLEELSGNLNALQAKHVYNFAGELWQRLVTDREERAEHYTKPEVAELLATLAAQRFIDRNVDEVASLDVMDAACGTGTLIGAGERALRRISLLKGGDISRLHRKRMEDHIIALDVNGIAGTMTAKRLTDLEVAQDYQESRIAIVTHEAGSLCLLNPETTGITDMLGSGGRGLTPGQSSSNGMVRVPVGSVDWALMNPPYSRARKGREQATTGLDPLRDKAKKYGWNMSNGMAGIAPDFGAISNIRLRKGGVFAHVLPLTAAHAEGWQAWRAEIEKDFKDIVAIANVGPELASMSADTQMNELLVVATKRESKPKVWSPTRVVCVNLSGAPISLAQGYAIAKEIERIPSDEDHGVFDRGTYVHISPPSPGFPWFAAGTRDFEMTTVATALMRGSIYDPLRQTTTTLGLDGVPLSKLAHYGPSHDTIGHPKGGDGRGAFEWHPIEEWNGVPTHLSMWSVDTPDRQMILTKPTHAGVVVDQTKAQERINERSMWFVNRTLRWTTQMTPVACTRINYHGGRAWNALQDCDQTTMQCVALWYNSIFGAIPRQVYSQSTQPGRATFGVKAIAELPCLDFGADNPRAERAREVANANFAEASELKLEPFVYCFRDESRHRIDDITAEMIGLDPSDASVQEMMAHYRILFASEPNVNDRKSEVLAALEAYLGNR